MQLCEILVLGFRDYIQYHTVFKLLDNMPERSIPIHFLILQNITDNDCQTSYLVQLSMEGWKRYGNN